MRYAIDIDGWEVDMVDGPEQIRILILSRSPYTRYVISAELSSYPDLFVVGTAQTPEEIVYKKAMLRPNLVIVDLESQQGLSDFRPVLLQGDVPVLALCPQNRESGELTFAALEAGATDVIAYPNCGLAGSRFGQSLSRKVRRLAGTKPRPLT